VGLFKSAARRFDGWLAHYSLGRAYLDAGAFAQAHDELERSLTRRFEAASVFLDGVPTARLIPPVMFHLGQARESLGEVDSADIYRDFIASRKSQEDPLLAEARRRMGRASNTPH
jgi:hypothetical protein